ncbi:MAG: hypothetical protein H7125_00765 [Proteobacteria bacterium]|nr:hypothetical protein [Burkholderiales bacterium]
MLIVAALATPNLTHAWTFSWLAPADGDVSTFATSINASGQVVGASRSGSLDLSNDTSAGAVRWSAGTYSSGPDVVSGLYPYSSQGSIGGPRRGYATAVNAAGSFTTSDPVLWTASSGPRTLETVFGTGASAVGSPVGIGAGETIVGNAPAGPYIWDPAGGRRNLGSVVGSFSTTVNGLSPNGRFAVGSASLDGTPIGASFANERVAVLWDQSGQHAALAEPTRYLLVPSITFPPATGGGFEESLNLQPYTRRSGIAHAVNDLGEVVGASGGQVGPVFVFPSFAPPQRAVIWDRNGNPRLLDTRPGNATSEALAINALGAAVGTQRQDYLRVGESASRAMLWDPVLGEVDLNALPGVPDGWLLYDAVGINDAGQIVGNGQFNGRSQGFVLSPDVQVVPLPASAFLFLAGSLLLTGCTHRFRIRTR